MSGSFCNQTPKGPKLCSDRCGISCLLPVPVLGPQLVPCLLASVESGPQYKPGLGGLGGFCTTTATGNQNEHQRQAGRMEAAGGQGLPRGARNLGCDPGWLAWRETPFSQTGGPPCLPCQLLPWSTLGPWKVLSFFFPTPFINSLPWQDQLSTRESPVEGKDPQVLTIGASGLGFHEAVGGDSPSGSDTVQP